VSGIGWTSREAFRMDHLNLANQRDMNASVSI